jgi:hypothetical protein
MRLEHAVVSLRGRYDRARHDITVSRKTTSAQIFLLHIEGDQLIFVLTTGVAVSPAQYDPLTETVYGTEKEVRKEGSGEEAGCEEGGAEEGR